MKDCYKLVGTSREAVYLTDKTEIEQDRHIKEKYDFTKKQIKFKKENPYITPERLKQLEEEEKQCEEAYEKIKTAPLRRIYNQAIEEQARIENWKSRKDQDFEELKEKCNNAMEKIVTVKEKEISKINKYEKFKKKYQCEPIKGKKTPYQVLDFNEETLEMRSDIDNDIILQDRKDKFLISLYEELKKADNLTALDKIIARIDEVKQAYEEVKSPERRKEYKERIEKEREKKKEREER